MNVSKEQVDKLVETIEEEISEVIADFFNEEVDGGVGSMDEVEEVVEAVRKALKEKWGN